MAKKNEEKTVPVFNEELLKLLPKTTKESIDALSKDLKVDGLTIFNPIVENLAVIEEFRKIKYKPEDKVCIDKFKTAKKFIRSFNAATKKSKKDLKKPFLETGRKIDAIEKLFLESAKDVLEKIEKEFKPYLDSEAEKKRIREEKKQAKQLEEMSKLTDENEEQKLVIQRTQKVAELTKNINEFLMNASKNVANFSVDAIKREIQMIQNAQFVLTLEDEKLLLPEQIQQLQELFISVTNNALIVYENRLQSIARETNVEPVKVEPSVQENVPSMIAPSLDDTNPNFFRNSINHILESAITDVSNLNPANDNERLAQEKVVNGLTQYTKKVEELFNSFN